jgi:hypothetical protein
METLEHPASDGLQAWVPFRLVFGEPAGRWAFAAAGAAATLAYSLLLPFAYTQRLGLANWRFLDGRLLAFALGFGLVLGWIAALQVVAARRVHDLAGPRAGGVLGAVAVGLLPNLLCCTPVIPTLLALAGTSALGVYSRSGVWQSFFARHETAFLGASLALLTALALWSGRRVAEAACPCCTLPAEGGSTDGATDPAGPRA